MKKTIPALVFALTALLPFCGCAKNESSNTKTGGPAMNNIGKALVVYFSATGTTKGVAQRLAGAIRADIFEIVPAKPYTDADLNWRNKQSRSSVNVRRRIQLYKFSPSAFCRHLYCRIQKVDLQKVVVADMYLAILEHRLKFLDDAEKVFALIDIVTMESIVRHFAIRSAKVLA